MFKSTGDKSMTAVEFARDVGQLLKETRSSSYIEYTRSTRVEPLTVIDTSASMHPDIDVVLNSTLNIISSYYLQAVHLSIGVENVDIMRTLDKLNPNRDPFESASSSRYLDHMTTTSIEGNVPKSMFTMLNDSNVKTLNDASNLSIGKLLNVKVKNGNNEASFPVNVRLISRIVPPEILANLSGDAQKDASLKERYYLLKSNQIRFVKDFILCEDMISEHKKMLIEDSSGIYRSRSRARANNKLSAILSGQPSVATASSVVVMTSDTAKIVENRSRGRLSNERHRNKIFDNNLAMIIAVIDTDLDAVTFYYRSIPDSTTVSIKELRRVNRGKGGPDILEVLNALSDSRGPSF